MGLLTEYWSIDFLVTLGSSVILLYFYMTRNFKYWNKRGVMEIEPTPFVGNLGECLRAKKSAGQWLQDMYNWGAGLPYIGFYVFDRPFFLVRDPKLIKDILVRDFNYFHDRFSHSSQADPLTNGNMFFIKNPAWKYLRSKITPIYTSGKLKKMFDLMVEVGGDLHAHMESLLQDGSDCVIELKELSAKFTTDLIGTTAFGLRVNSLNDPNAEFRKRGRDILTFTLSKNIGVTAMFFAPHLAERFKFTFISLENSNFLRRAVWSTMEERKRSGVKRGDLIDLLLELKETQSPGPEKELFEFDGDNIVAQAAVFFTAGFETSSTALSFALYELGVNPEIQAKVRDEILTALKEHNGKVTYDMVMGMPYLDMVVSESLRKYPPLVVLDRVAVQDYRVPDSDVTLKKGTPVYIPITGLHYDPQYYPDPQEFDPERFTLENRKTRPSSVYLPFGDGPHSCIGGRLGLLQVKLGLIELVQKYEFSPCKKTLIPMRLDPGNFMTSADGGIFLNIRKISAK